MKRLVEKKILITGAAGFIGANLTRRLYELGAGKLHVLIRQSSDTWRINDILCDLNVHRVDLGNKDDVAKTVRSVRPEVIFHSAAYGGYPHQKDERAIFDTNVGGILNLMDALSDVEYGSFINIGSSSEYGIKPRSMKEIDPAEPIDTYGVAKAAATLYAQRIAMTEKRPITTVRLFSVYGPYEDENRLVPSVIVSCITDGTLVVKSPDSVRDFVYIDDVVELLLKAALKKRSLGIINCGSGRQRSVKDVINTAVKISGSSVDMTFLKRNKKLEPKPWVADIRKAKRLLGWTPRTTFEEGIRRTIEWMDKRLMEL